MENNITLDEKIYTISLIWKEAEYNFAFWDNLKDLNWDEAYKETLKNIIKTNDIREYYLELLKFVSLLRDGHTRIDYFNNIIEMYGVFPLRICYLNNKHIIMNTNKCFEDKIFCEIYSINGISMQQYIEEKIFPYIWHEKFDSAYWQIWNMIPIIEAGNEITIETDNGFFKVKPLKENIEWVKNYSFAINEKINQIYKTDILKVGVTHDNLAVITIPLFEDDNLPAEFYSILQQIKDCSGFLIDVRWNGGGSSYNGDAVAQAFLNGSFDSGRHKIPVHRGVHKAWGMQYRKMEDETFSTEVKECPLLINSPVVILENTDTASAAEDFLIDFDNIQRATIVGTPSYGSTGQPLFIELPGGGNVRICTRWCLYPNGKEFINIGVMPHIHADLTLNDYKNNFDSVLETGLKVLREKVSNSLNSV